MELFRERGGGTYWTFSISQARGHFLEGYSGGGEERAVEKEGMGEGYGAFSLLVSSCRVHQLGFRAISFHFSNFVTSVWFVMGI